MSGRFGLVYPLWNETLDPGDLLDRVLDEVGVDHVTVPVVTGPVSEFRMTAPQRPHRSFATEGGWHYPPDPGPYEDTGIRPHLARWSRSKKQVFERLRERLAAANVALVLRVELRSVTPLFEDYPQFRMRDAWGDDQPALGGCVVNPQLGALLRATLEDLARFEPRGVQVVGWTVDRGARTGGSPPFAHLPWAAQQMAETCFCAACRETAQRVGLDADQAAAAARQQVFDLAAVDPSHEPAEHLHILEEYRRHRVAEQEAWLESLCTAAPETQRWLLHIDGDTCVSASGWGQAVQCGPGAAGCLSQSAALVAQEIRAVSLPVWRPAFDSSAELVRSVRQAAQTGIHMFDFDDLATAAPEALTWLKQAVRFGRREAGGETN